jgi:EmrB/QacA subfamily drug resistance transporter
MTDESQPGGNGVRRGPVLAVLSLAAFMASLDLFIVNVAFEDIRRDFGGTPLADLSWILNGYAIVFAALLIPLGRLADRYGRKAGFLLGLGVFTAASLACALCTGLWPLVVARLLQAAGAAALTPASLGLLLAVYPPERRVGAVRVWAATGALAAAAGPVVGGVLVEASWRWVFVVNVPVGVLALVAAWRLVPGSRDASVARMPDLLGAAVAAVAFGSLSLGLVKGAAWGWTAGTTLAAFAVAVVALAWSWVRAGRHPSPIVEPALLRVRPFVWANLTAILFNAAFAANLLVSVLWMQQVWGWSALRSGLAFAPGPLMVPVLAALSQRFAGRVSLGRVAAAGCLLFAAGLGYVTASIGAEAHYATDLLPGLLVAGAGVGLALPTILSAASADLPPSRTATGSAVVNMSRQVGAVLGVSLLVAVVGTPTTYAEWHTGFVLAGIGCAAFSVLAAVAAPRMSPRGPGTDRVAVPQPAAAA